QQALFHRHGHADVDVLVVADLVAEPAAVHLGMLAQRHGHSLDDEVVVADLVRLDRLVDRLTHSDAAGHVHGHGEVEMRRAVLAFGQAPGNGLAHLAYLYLGEALFLHGHGRHAAGQVPLDVLLHDAAVVTGPAHPLDVDSPLLGQATGQWTGLDAAVR